MSMSTTAMILHNEEKIRHAPQSLLPTWLKAERTRTLTPDNIQIQEYHGGQPSATIATATIDSGSAAAAAAAAGSSSVVYWMQRDVRTADNWALLFAAHVASVRHLALHVVYALPPPPPSAAAAAASNASEEEVEEDLPPTMMQMPMTARHGHFLLGGLQHVHHELQKENIPLHVVMAESHERVGDCVVETIRSSLLQAETVISDFSPLRHARQWMELQAAPLLAKAGIPFYQVDAHNIVPVWMAADKQQVGARTLRPRIHRVLKDYLKDDFPSLSSVMKLNNNSANNTTIQQKGCVAATHASLLPKFERDVYEAFLQMDESVPPVDDWAMPGTQAALDQFESFVQHGLKDYHTKRNDPNEQDICSNLSPWINHGHISFARLAMKVHGLNKYATGAASFLEEGIVRRELSDNYVYYCHNNAYDSLGGAADWARTSLHLHASDAREYVYTLEQLEEAATYDDLWNAAQMQVVRHGHMHGFMRMYWAKKILEWTPSPQFALRAAQYLNDKYALDGKDPNGFVGVAWSIMGVHDQGWKERAVFGKIRYMNYNGCKRKFNVAAFVAMYDHNNSSNNNNNNDNAAATNSTVTTKKTAATATTGAAATTTKSTSKKSNIRGGKRPAATSSGTKKQRT
jgi:deoxyribodipyrimidine photo-lyase